jgi:hypothetical protein
MLDDLDVGFIVLAATGHDDAHRLAERPVGQQEREGRRLPADVMEQGEAPLPAGDFPVPRQVDLVAGELAAEDAPVRGLEPALLDVEADDLGE